MTCSEQTVRREPQKERVVTQELVLVVKLAVQDGKNQLLVSIIIRIGNSFLLIGRTHEEVKVPAVIDNEAGFTINLAGTITVLVTFRRRQGVASLTEAGVVRTRLWGDRFCPISVLFVEKNVVAVEEVLIADLKV